MTDCTAQNEEWLTNLIDSRFESYERSPSNHIRDELYVLIGTLKIVGFTASHEESKKRLLASERPKRATERAGRTDTNRAGASHAESKEAERLEPQPVADLRGFLAGKIVGQDAAVAQVAERLSISRAGLKLRSEKPNAVMLFAGPTGVGKTELARQLATAEYGDPEAIIRLDMSEYGSRVSASRLIGPDPGYAGYDDSEGWLTTRVRRKPRSVILLDEFEKAHPATWSTFLQVFDAGRLTDGHGRTADFSQTVIVMTSNLGAREAARMVPGFGSASGDARARQLGALTEAMPPEFVNRIDEIVFFEPLEIDALEAIAEAELAAFAARLAKTDWSIEVGEGVPRWLAKKGYDPAYGARHVQRTLERHVVARLAELPSRRVRLEVEESGLKLVAG